MLTILSALHDRHAMASVSKYATKVSLRGFPPIGRNASGMSGSDVVPFAGREVPSNFRYVKLTNPDCRRARRISAQRVRVVSDGVVRAFGAMR